jgi:hypothetical protein
MELFKNVGIQEVKNIKKVWSDPTPMGKIDYVLFNTLRLDHD